MQRLRSNLSSTLLAIVIFLFSCNNHDQSARSSPGSSKNDSAYRIRGMIRGIDTAWITLTYEQDDRYLSDTTEIINGVFEFTGKTAYPVLAFLKVIDSPEGDVAGLFLDTGVITVDAVKDSMTQAIVSGTPTNLEFSNYKKILQPISKRIDSLIALHKTAKANNDVKKTDSIESLARTLYAEQTIIEKKYIKTHPGSFIAAAKILEFYSYYPPVAELDSIYSALYYTIRESAVGKKIFSILTTAKKTNIGQPAPEFSMNDENDKPIALSSYRGKYVLIDFWASWCGPCRAENPSILKAYTTNHPKGFEILGISFDTDREKWLKAIADDHLIWKQVSELKGWYSKTGELYGVHSIPMNFLLDRNGKIIASDLTGAALTKKLAGLL